MAEIFPISYWGSLLYFSELVKHRQVALECYETFPKQTHRNRFHIVSPQGLLPVTIPVFKPNGSKTLTKDISILQDKSGFKKNWKSVTSAYASSPFFDHYELELKELFLSPNENLVQHCLDINSFLLNAWGFEIEFRETTNFDWKTQSSLLHVDFLSTENQYVWKNYTQVQFHETSAFFPNTSALDLLCNLGPMARKIVVDPFIRG